MGNCVPLEDIPILVGFSKTNPQATITTSQTRILDDLEVESDLEGS